MRQVTAFLIGCLSLLMGCSELDDREFDVASPPPRTGAEVAEAAESQQVPPPPEALPVPQRKPPVVAGVAVSDPEQLIGLDSARIAELLGRPAAEAEVSPARVWTYKGKSCVLQIFLYPEINTKEFRALTYAINNGTDAAGRQQCLEEVLRANATG